MDEKIIKAIEEGFKDLNKTVECYLERKREDDDIIEERGKVTFTFPSTGRDIDLISNRYKLVNVLYELSNYRRTLERYDVPGEIYVMEGKILSDEQLHDYNRTQEDVEKTETYIKIEEVINKINDILDIVPYNIYED